MSKEFVRRISPTTLSIPELRQFKELAIFEKIYRMHPLLMNGIDNGWTFKLVSEMHRTQGSRPIRQ